MGLMILAYGGVVSIQLFIIRVPAHVIIAVTIQVQQARVEFNTSNGLQLRLAP